MQHVVDHVREHETRPAFYVGAGAEREVRREEKVHAQRNQIACGIGDVDIYEPEEQVVNAVMHCGGDDSDNREAHKRHRQQIVYKLFNPHDFLFDDVTSRSVLWKFLYRQRYEKKTITAYIPAIIGRLFA